jgi:hypothetical protein
LLPPAAKQTPVAFFQNPNKTRPLSAGPLFIVRSRCHYSHSLSHFNLIYPHHLSSPPCTSFQKPLKRIFVASSRAAISPVPTRAPPEAGASTRAPSAHPQSAKLTGAVQRTLSLLSRPQDTGGGAERTSSICETPCSTSLLSLYLPLSYTHTHPSSTSTNHRHSLPPPTLAVAQAPSRPWYHPLTSPVPPRLVRCESFPRPGHN